MVTNITMTMTLVTATVVTIIEMTVAMITMVFSQMAQHVNEYKRPRPG